MASNSEKTEKSYYSGINRALAKIPLVIIKAYQYGISPLMGSQCRFHPTCSNYAEESYRRFGFIKGTWLTVRRLLKCHPWHKGGVDMVP